VETNGFSPNFDKQDRHCTYYVTLRRIPLTILAVDNQYVLQIQSVCFSFSYLTYKMHEPYNIVTCGVSGSTNIFHVNS
jgi:hypothetical protein